MNTTTSYVIRHENKSVYSSITLTHWYSGYTYACKSPLGQDKFYVVGFFGPFYKTMNATRYEVFPSSVMAPWDGELAYHSYIHYEGLACNPKNGDSWAITDNAVIRIDLVNGPQYIAGHPTLYGNIIADGRAARFRYLRGIDVAYSGNAYVTDYGTNRIIKISPSGHVTLLAGGGASGDQAGYLNGRGSIALFNGPIGVTVDQDEVVYVADVNNRRIRRITPDGQTTTVAGNGTNAHVDGGGNESCFFKPTFIAVDQSANILVIDRTPTSTSYLSRVSESGTCSTLDGPASGMGYIWSLMCEKSTGEVFYLSNQMP